ncbi:MAG TPA: protein kinase [Humibacter sp.]|nr:protein kinase [Humibacter sp.]
MDEVIGYRLVRTLGVGSRGTVQLARPRSGESAVALKVFDAGVSVDVIDHEAAVLSAVASEHVVALLDVCSLPGAPPVFVLERLNTTSLAWLLRSRSRLSIGEAITVLVSMTRGVRALHDAGFAHGRLGAAKVLFGAGNRPVIAGLGHAISLASNAAPAAGATSGSATVGTGGDAASAARLADWRTVRDIAVAVFDRVDVLGREAQVDEVRSAFDAMAGGRGLAGDHERVEDALFALAPPAPVAVRPRSMRAPGSADGTATAVRAAASAPIRGPGRRSADSEQQEPAGRHDKPEPAPAGRRRHSSRRREPGWADGRAVGRALGRIAEQTLERGPLSILREHVARLVRARRRPVAVAAILATGLVAGGVLLLPPSQQAADAGTRATAPPSPHSSPRPLPSDAQASTTASSGAATGGTATGGGHDPTESLGASDDPITSDDPVAAASALFDARSRCLRGRSAACLASVDERTSPVYADDVDRTARTSTRDAGDEADYAQFGVSLIERIGGSALVALSPPSGATDAEPATALVIKGEAGWRIRQIYLN